jgi:plastocyanin
MTVIPSAAKNLAAIARPSGMPQRRLPPRPTAFALCALIAITAACSSSKDNSSDPLVTGGAEETVVMTDNEFNPGNLQVPAGAQVTFRNDGDAVHNAEADDGAWDTDNISRDESETITLDEPGEFDYTCTLHPSMKGKITVID